MAKDERYSDPHHAYFIAGGRTLEVIRQFERDIENSRETLDAIAREFGARRAHADGTVIAEEQLRHPALVFEREEAKGFCLHHVSDTTREGAELRARLRAIPTSPYLDRDLFAERLTGRRTTPVNPDGIDPSFLSQETELFEPAQERRAASYRKYGDVYVVEVPRTLRAVFGAEARTDRDGMTWAEGYRFEWFTPEDSTPIAWSKVVELQEGDMGTQTQPRARTTPVPVVKKPGK